MTCPNHTARLGRRDEQALPTLTSELDASHLPFAPSASDGDRLAGCGGKPSMSILVCGSGMVARDYGDLFSFHGPHITKHRLGPQW